MSGLRNMLAPGYAGFAHVASGLPYPAAGTDRPVSDGAPRLASQIEAAVALRDRLNRDRVAHRVDDAHAAYATAVLDAFAGVAERWADRMETARQP